MRKWGNRDCQFIQLWQSFKLCQSLRWKSDVLGLLGVFGRKRKSSEEGWEKIWWKKSIRRVGVAYRELIGSLYESWTIGIERVYKWLTHSTIQRCKKWWKQGFEAKEKGILTPFTYSPIRRLLPRRGGVVTRDKWRMTKVMWWKYPPLHILRSRGLPFKGGIRDRKGVRS